MENKNFVGVGGLIAKKGKYLLVRHTYGEYKGLWLLPGGHVKPGEHIDNAVEREVYEETSVSARAERVIAIRSRVRSENCTDCYLIFEMNYQSGTPVSDNYENDDARFLSVDEINRLKNIVALAKIIINEHYRGSLSNIPRNINIKPYDGDSAFLKLFL